MLSVGLTLELGPDDLKDPGESLIGDRSRKRLNGLNKVVRLLSSGARRLTSRDGHQQRPGLVAVDLVTPAWISSGEANTQLMQD